VKNLICLKTKCEDYSTDGGEPVWCIRVGSPAVVAVNKCPKITENKAEKGRRHDNDS